MKINSKKILNTLLYFLLLNLLIIILHFFAFVGIAFNDSGDQFRSIVELLPRLCIMLAPIVVFSVPLIEFFSRKKELSKLLMYILQSIVVMSWVMIYTYAYVPTSLVRTFFNNMEKGNMIEQQELINERSKEELSSNGYLEMENITNKNQNISIYIKNNSTIVLKYKNNNTINYCISDVEQINFNLIHSRIKYSKINSNYTTIMDYDNNLYVCLNNTECFKIKREDLELYDNERVSVGYVYYKMLNESVINNESKYIPNDIKYLQIEKNDNLITITAESLKNITIDYNEQYFDYGWVIKKDGEQILSRAIKPNKLYLNFEEIDEKFFLENGNYEIYLNIYFDTDLYDSGYIKASNSITWKN